MSSRAGVGVAKKKTVAALVSAPVVAPVVDDRYDDFLAGVQKHFSAAVKDSPQLFETDASGLWEAYLANAPAGERQNRTCNACQAFIRKFGGLVTISAKGEIESAVWPLIAPAAYETASRAMRKLVAKANVTGVFRSDTTAWGTKKTGKWTHISLMAPAASRWTSRTVTAGQEMAAKLEDFKMLQRGLADFSLGTITMAASILRSDALYRSEKVLGVAEWLFKVQHSLSTTKNKKVQANLLWQAVATAPTGFCHVRSSMIGTLLDDIQAGLPFESVKRKFAEKMNPLQYMRPTAPPAAGNIAQAEKIVSALKSAGALERRFAKLEDIQALWKPKPVRPAPSGKHTGMFGHLLKPSTKTAVTSAAPAQLMTWSKFRDTILPTAEEIEFLVPHARSQYTAMVTAKNPSAPNLLQWGNTVSHYMYSNGSLPGDWALIGGRHCPVTAVSLRSWMWESETAFAHQGAGVVFVLKGARDVGYAYSGGMFPEQMKAEYHGVRKTLEAHFNSAAIEGKHEAEACGIALVKGQGVWNLEFRVTSRGVRTSYKLDRWD